MNTELKATARRLYLGSDLSKTEIASTLGIPRRTLYHWIKEQNWDYQKQCTAHTPVLIADNCYHILSNYTNQLLERTDVMINSKEADTLHKLVITIGKLTSRTTVSENIQMLGDFVKSVSETAPDLAGSISPHIDNFIAAGAPASVRPSLTELPSPAEAEKEAQLDLSYAAENTAPPSSGYTQQRPPSIATRAEQAARHRLHPPTCTELLAHLYTQNQTVWHLHATSRPYFRAAAA